MPLRGLCAAGDVAFAWGPDADWLQANWIPAPPGGRAWPLPQAERATVPHSRARNWLIALGQAGAPEPLPRLSSYRPRTAGDAKRNKRLHQGGQLLHRAFSVVKLGLQSGDRFLSTSRLGRFPRTAQVPDRRQRDVPKLALIVKLAYKRSTSPSRSIARSKYRSGWGAGYRARKASIVNVHRRTFGEHFARSATAVRELCRLTSVESSHRCFTRLQQGNG